MAQKISPEAGPRLLDEDDSSKMQAKEVKLCPLFVAVLLFVMIPGITFLQRGIGITNDCHQLDSECRSNCETEWDKYIATLQGNEKFKTLEQKKELNQCFRFCASDISQCSIESMLFLTAAICLGASFFCMMWLTTIALNTIVIEDTAAEEEATARVKQNPKARRLAGHINLKDALSLVEIEEVESTKCIHCSFPLPKTYAEVQIGWSTNCLEAAPVYCSSCGGLQFGII